MLAMRNLGLPSDYADAGSVQTAKFKRPADAYSKASVFAATNPSEPAVGGQCPPGTVQQGLVCVQIPKQDPPTQPPPSCPGGMYWTGGECAPTSPPPPLPGPQTPPTPFWDVGQQAQPAPAGAQIVTQGVLVPPGYYQIGSSVYPKWWFWLGGAIAIGTGAFLYKRRA